MAGWKPTTSAGLNRLGGVVLLALSLATGTPAPAGAGEVFRIGASPTGILIWMAQDFGLFADSGVTVAVSRVSSGVEALNRVQAGQLELGTSSEFAFVSRAMQDENLCIYATISASRTVALLARSDRVAPGASGLDGARIGVTLGSVARFMLWQYLTLTGIPESRVTLVDLNPDELVEAMRAGTVDAGIVWEPYVGLIRHATPVDLIEYPDQIEQHYYFALQGRCDLDERRPADLKAVLSALVDAEKRVRQDEAAARAAFADRFGIERGEADRMWPQHSLSVRLPQDLLSLMESESQWRIAERLDDGPAPDFLSRIKFQPLAEVAPSAVQIIR
ncbi:ABC transporter substrate-binding protein [Thalassobaculum sp.]|uniref:ABC transporter substrate-binding protein n=1 Tax=Thalassobaculum sp. TaxID=2022740 RepID=UPI0032EC7BD4